MSFVLYTINVEYLCDASYVTWKYRQYRRYHVIFVRKYKTFQKINIRGPDPIVVEPHFWPTVSGEEVTIKKPMGINRDSIDWHLVRRAQICRSAGLLWKKTRTMGHIAHLRNSFNQ